MNDKFVEKSFREIIGRSPGDKFYKGQGGAQRYRTDYDRFIQVRNENRASYAARLKTEAQSRGALLEAQEAITLAAPCGALDLNCYMLKFRSFFSGAFRAVMIVGGLLMVAYFSFIFLKIKSIK